MTLVLICPLCEATYPPGIQEFLSQYGKCLFCDTPKCAWLRKRLPSTECPESYITPFFPSQRIDLDQYIVQLPFLERVLDQMHISQEERQIFLYATKLELIRAQIKSEIHNQRRPKVIGSDGSE